MSMSLSAGTQLSVMSRDLSGDISHPGGAVYREVHDLTLWVVVSKGVADTHTGPAL